MSPVDLSRAVWRKSSRSDTGSDKWWCVEVASLPGVVAVRDSKDPGGGTLVFSRGEWRSFARSLRGIGRT